MAKKKTPKIWSPEQIDPSRYDLMGYSIYERFKYKRPVNIVPPDAGVYHTEVPEALLTFIDAANQHKIEHNNAFIVLGRDRPSDETSGYGRAGAQRAASIDLVVGRMSSLNDGEGPVDGAEVHNHYGCDAARIVISQTTDIDTNFGLDNGSLGNIKGRSGIGIKADSVRIIGREGIKIVTGKAPFKNFGFRGETNSRGGTIIPAPSIDLIAGNNTDPIEFPGTDVSLPFSVDALQPVVLGDNALEAMRELSFLLDEVWSALFNLALVQNSINSIVSVDVIMPQGGAKAAAAPVAASQVIDSCLNSLWHTRANKLAWEQNYLEEYGAQFICSKNVNTT